MISGRDKEVKDFIKKLHSGDYKIDLEANRISYGNGKTLAQALSDALETYQDQDVFTLNPPPFTAAYAYSLITSCFAHGVIKTKSDKG